MLVSQNENDVIYISTCTIHWINDISKINISNDGYKGSLYGE